MKITEFLRCGYLLQVACFEAVAIVTLFDTTISLSFI